VRLGGPRHHRPRGSCTLTCRAARRLLPVRWAANALGAFFSPAPRQAPPFETPVATPVAPASPTARDVPIGWPWIAGWQLGPSADTRSCQVPHTRRERPHPARGKGLSSMDIVAVLTRVVQEQERAMVEERRAMQAASRTCGPNWPPSGRPSVGEGARARGRTSRRCQLRPGGPGGGPVPSWLARTIDRPCDRAVASRYRDLRAPTRVCWRGREPRWPLPRRLAVS
jgi:hypothetical protein